MIADLDIWQPRIVNVGLLIAQEFGGVATEELTGAAACFQRKITSMSLLPTPTSLVNSWREAARDFT